MDDLTQQVAALPTLAVNGHHYLSYQAVTDTVAALLFPDQATSQIDASDYQHILETADTLCRELGYHEVIRLTPPDVALSQMGLYWCQGAPPPAPDDVLYEDESQVHIIKGPGRMEMIQSGQLHDVRLHQWGLDEVTRQHFKIPVLASDSVLALIERAVASAWPNDYKGVWADILGMCITGGQDNGRNERHFTVIIRGLKRRYWQFKAQLRRDESEAPFLCIGLADETWPDAEPVDDLATAPSAVQVKQPYFTLGHVVMTPGVAALGIDVLPYLKRHAHKDWGDLCYQDKRENNYALKHGLRILSAYDVPLANGETERIWVITEADRSATTFLLPSEY
jgi:hypothetical protein